MFHGSFGTQNSMVTFIFKFDLEKGQLQVQLGQIKSNFKTKTFVKICLYCTVLSQEPKISFTFYVRQLEMPKVAFQKCDIITFTWFSGHCTAKTTILL